MLSKEKILLLIILTGILLLPKTVLGKSPRSAESAHLEKAKQNLKEQNASQSELDREALYQKLSQQYKNRKKEIADPLEPWNRVVFRFNDKLYTYMLTPVSEAYTYVLPQEARGKIGNIYHNLLYPKRFINDVLQLRIKAAAKETGSFIVNTVFGFLGCFDVAQDIDYLKNPSPEHNGFGLTLQSWGVGEGIYIVWPFFGPRTLRSSVGMAGNYFSVPSTYIKPWQQRWSLKGEKGLNNLPGKLKTYKDMKETAIAPYTAVKDGYLQYRKSRLPE